MSDQDSDTQTASFSREQMAWLSRHLPPLTPPERHPSSPRTVSCSFLTRCCINRKLVTPRPPCLQPARNTGNPMVAHVKIVHLSFTGDRAPSPLAGNATATPPVLGPDQHVNFVYPSCTGSHAPSPQADPHINFVKPFCTRDRAPSLQTGNATAASPALSPLTRQAAGSHGSCTRISPTRVLASYPRQWG